MNSTDRRCQATLLAATLFVAVAATLISELGELVTWLHVTQVWLATSDDPEARSSSGGY